MWHRCELKTWQEVVEFESWCDQTRDQQLSELSLEISRTMRSRKFLHLIYIILQKVQQVETLNINVSTSGLRLDPKAKSFPSMIHLTTFSTNLPHKELLPLLKNLAIAAPSLADLTLGECCTPAVCPFKKLDPDPTRNHCWYISAPILCLSILVVRLPFQNATVGLDSIRNMYRLRRCITAPPLSLHFLSARFTRDTPRVVSALQIRLSFQGLTALKLVESEIQRSLKSDSKSTSPVLPWSDFTLWRNELANIPDLRRIDISLCTGKKNYHKEVRENWAREWMFNRDDVKNGIETIHFDWKDIALDKFVWDPVSREVIGVDYSQGLL